MSCFHTEIPHFRDRLQPISDRLRLLSQYLEQPGSSEFDAAAGILFESAEQLDTLMGEVDRANAEIHRQYGCCGRVEVVFHAN